MTRVDLCVCSILQGIVSEEVRKSWLEQWEQWERRRETQTDQGDLQTDCLSVKCSHGDRYQRHCKKEMMITVTALC